MGRRRKAREEALKILFEYDSTGDDIDEIIHCFWENFSTTKDRKVREYAKTLVKGVVDNLNDIDKKIEKVSKNWKLQRMFKVDKNILRIAVFELLYKNDTPVPVVIDEAVEIAKTYGTETSHKFINGILDSINKKFNNK